MNNPYTSSFEDIRALCVEYYKRKTRERMDKWYGKIGRAEVEKQIAAKAGPIVDEINADIRASSKRSESVEFICAMQLADFYFPNADKQISFEMRRGVDPKSIKTFEQFLDSFEDHTYIDCLVKSGKQSVSFQLKRYRGESNPSDFIKWLNSDRVLKHYGDMSGTSLVVLLQPSNNAESPLALDELYEAFKKDALPNVSFDSVSLMYNDATSGHMVLHELHPRHHRKLVELNLALARMRGDA